MTSDAERKQFEDWFKVFAETSPNTLYDRSVAWPAWCAAYAAGAAAVPRCEPVAWTTILDMGKGGSGPVFTTNPEMAAKWREAGEVTPLYAAPARQEDGAVAVPITPYKICQHCLAPLRDDPWRDEGSPDHDAAPARQDQSGEVAAMPITAEGRERTSAPSTSPGPTPAPKHSHECNAQWVRGGLYCICRSPAPVPQRDELVERIRNDPWYGSTLPGECAERITSDAAKLTAQEERMGLLNKSWLIAKQRAEAAESRLDAATRVIAELVARRDDGVFPGNAVAWQAARAFLETTKGSK